MADTDFKGFTPKSVIGDTDTLIGETSAGGGVNYPGAAFAKRDTNGCIIGGFGALTAGGVTNWNDVSNARSGQGVSCLTGDASNGPLSAGATAGALYHPFSFEIGTAKDGSNNLTQLAIPYANATSVSSGIYMRGKSSGTWTGWYQILSETTSGAFAPGIDNTKSLGAPSLRFSVVYAATSSINTSDEREKQQIEAIPAAWLDAWADVEWRRFKFNDSVAEKGDAGARWHTGLVAQQVRDAFAAHGLDAAEIGLIGLLCHDEWEGTPAQPEVVNEDGETVTPAQPATEGGDRWGLRYEECFAVEAAYQRRRMAAIEARLAVLEGETA